MLTGVAIFAGRFALLAAVSAVLAEAAASVGCGLLALIRARTTGALEKFGLGLLAGWGVAGTALLGLALVGTFYPVVIAGTGLLLIVGARASSGRGSLVLAAISEARGVGWLGLGILAAGFAPVVPGMMVPEFEIDCEIYHLGLAGQYLEAHRALLSLVPAPFHLPLPIDISFVVPLILNDDRLAKWMVASMFAAAAAVVVADARRNGSPLAGWAGVLLLLSTGTVLWLVRTSKNDVPAAALFMAGAVVFMSGRRRPGSLLLGLCVTAKIICGPLVAAWYLFHFPPRRKLASLALIVALPLVPWLVKTLLATGNPLYPVAYWLFPSLDWGPENAKSAIDSSMWMSESQALATFPGAWLKVMRQQHLVLLLALPGLLLLGRDRRAAWASVLGSAGILAVGHTPRYLLPAAAILYVAMGREMAAWTAGWRRGVVWLVVACALARIGLAPENRGQLQTWSYKPLAGTYAAMLSTRQEVLPALEKLRREFAASWPPGEAPAFRVLSVGDWRTYRFPARILYAGVRGETPVIWRMARVSRSPAELRKRFRQLGTDILLYNFVSAEWLEVRFALFPWERDDLRRYVEFLKLYEEPLMQPQVCDYHNGGFFVFRFLPRPRPKPLPEVWYTPGAESVYSRATELMKANRNLEALGEYLRIHAMLPDVAHAWNVVGHVYLTLENHAKGYEYLKPFGAKGIMDSMNLGEYGASAVRVGELDLAEKMLEESRWRYPSQKSTVLANQAVLWATKASRLMMAGRLGEAEGWLKKADGVLAEMPPPTDRVQRDSYRTTRAMVFGLRGEFELLRGQGDKAREYFGEAYRTDPNGPMAPRWKDLSARLQSRLFGTGGP